jgi:hypothetical protein
MCGSNAFALCANGSKTVFSCSTVKEKKIEVCENKGLIEYSFGNPMARPEMVVRVPRAWVNTSQWDAGLRWSFHSVDIPNGATTYNVFWGNDQKSAKASQEGGVNVVTGDTVTTTVLCAPQTIVQALDTQSVAGNDH